MTGWPLEIGGSPVHDFQGAGYFVQAAGTFATLDRTSPVRESGCTTGSFRLPTQAAAACVAVLPQEANRPAAPSPAIPIPPKNALRPMTVCDLNILFHSRIVTGCIHRSARN